MTTWASRAGRGERGVIFYFFFFLYKLQTKKWKTLFSQTSDIESAKAPKFKPDQKQRYKSSGGKGKGSKEQKRVEKEKSARNKKEEPCLEGYLEPSLEQANFK